ncbi:MAG: hypothetical protein SV422_00265 [Pseudomonadota bacterium]|nr:hypothetical protein [Pseudomonadota bacterium]
MNNRHSAALADRKPEPASGKAIHTTLPMDDLIGIFESEIRRIVAFHSFEYEDARSATHIFHGVQKLHKLHYRLNVTALDLGRITLTRATPFTDKEIDKIEGALGALTIHLNNALEYQAGLGEQELIALRIDSEYSALD